MDSPAMAYTPQLETADLLSRESPSSLIYRPPSLFSVVCISCVEVPAREARLHQLFSCVEVLAGRRGAADLVITMWSTPVKIHIF